MTDPVRFTWLSSLNALELEAIRGLLNATIERDDVVGFVSPIASADHPYLLGLRHAVNTGAIACLAGFDGGSLVGMIHVKKDGQPNCRHRAELCKCMIHPRYRGRGILQQGLKHLLEYCRRENLEVVTLDVRKGSRAEVFWRRLGFIEYGSLPDYARVDSQPLAGSFLWASVERLGKHAATGGRA